MCQMRVRISIFAGLEKDFAANPDVPQGRTGSRAVAKAAATKQVRRPNATINGGKPPRLPRNPAGQPPTGPGRNNNNGAQKGLPAAPAPVAQANRVPAAGGPVAAPAAGAPAPMAAPQAAPPVHNNNGVQGTPPEKDNQKDAAISKRTAQQQQQPTPELGERTKGSSSLVWSASLRRSDTP